MSKPHTATLEGFTTRFQGEDARWIRERAQDRGCSMNEVIRTLVEDQRTMFRLPSMMAQRLNADRGDRSVQQYVIDLLTARHGEVIEPRRRVRRRVNSQP
jgi:hypothetical protein